MPFWYPVSAHPSAGGPPWFSHDSRGLVYQAHGHPAGPSLVSTFRLIGSIAYSIDKASTDDPWFEIVGSMVTPAEGHPAGRSREPWYQLRD